MARASSPPGSGPIALALVRREAAPGDELQAGGAAADVSSCRSAEVGASLTSPA